MDDQKRLKVYCETSFWSFLNGHPTPFILLREAVLL